MKRVELLQYYPGMPAQHDMADDGEPPSVKVIKTFDSLDELNIWMLTRKEMFKEFGLELRIRYKWEK